MVHCRELVATRSFGVNQICKLFGISKRSYYYISAPQENFERKYLYVKSYLEQLIKNNSGYGIRRLKQALYDEYAIVIGRDVLAKLLKLWKLSLKRKVRKSKPSVIQKILIWLGWRANILARTKITQPFQAITSDISRIYYANGTKHCYLCVHKDVFGQIVYGYCLSRNMETEIVIKSFKEAVRSIKKWIKDRFASKNEKLICHQDQGSQYTSYEYINLVLMTGCRLSFSEKGTPTDNPGQESFFGRFKDDWEDEILELSSFEEVKVFVKAKIRYYNNQRLHTSIGNKNPVSFTKISLNYLKNRFTKFRT